MSDTDGGGEPDPVRREVEGLRQEVRRYRNAPDPRVIMGIQRMEGRLRDHATLVDAERSRSNSRTNKQPASASGNETDSSGAAAPPPTGAATAGSSGENSSSTGDSASRDLAIRRFREDMASAEDLVLSAVEAFDPAADVDLATRIAVELLPILYRDGTAEERAASFVKERELKGSGHEKTVKRAARVLDTIVRRSKANPVNDPVEEKSCRTIYGHAKGLTNVHQRSHWKQPKGDQGKKWKTRVNFRVIQRIDGEERPEQSVEIQEMGKEVHDDPQREATMHKWPSKTDFLEEIYGGAGGGGN